MAAPTFREGARLGYPAGIDFTSGGTNYFTTYQGVKFGSGATAGQVIPCASAQDDIIGIIMNCPRGGIGDTADIQPVNRDGSSIVATGAAVSVGQLLTMDSTGRAVPATQTAGGSQPTVRVFGRALTAASAAGQIVEFMPLFFLY